jgi:hypothetical protein|nr:MAG TPA: hypothetical protein [Caudoviricetes sp.]
MALAQSLGTFENFKKHPVEGYVGSYDTFRPAQIEMRTTDALMTALEGTADTIIAAQSAAEDYRKEYGIAKAQQLINSTTEKDRLELDTRTLLANSGMLPLADNYYAMSLLDKNVGETANAAFTRDYMHALAEDPSQYKKTREEQLDDYVQKRKEYYNALKDRRPITNQIAFDLGFYDHAPVNEAALFDQHTKWLDAESHKEALINLGDRLKQYSLDYLWDTEKDDGETKRLIQAAINEAKLQGIRPEEIAKAVDGKINDYLLSGKSDKRALDALKELEIGVWHTQDDRFGSPMTYGQFMGTSISPYYKAFEAEQDKIFTRHDLEVRHTLEEAFKHSEQAGMDAYEALPDVDKKKYGSLIAGLISKGQNYRESLSRRSMKQAQAATEQQSNSDAFMRQVAIYRGGFLPDKSAKDAGFSGDDAAANALMAAYTGGIVSAEEALQLLNTPTFSSAKSRFKSYAVGQLGTLTSSMLNSSEGKQRAIATVDAFARQRSANPSFFAEVYGEDIDADIYLWKTLTESQGQDASISDYTAVMELKRDKEAWKGIESAGTKALGDYGDTIDILNLDEENKDAPSLAIPITTTPGLATLARTKLGILIGAGIAPEAAVTRVSEDISKNYWAYGYGALSCAIPKAVIDGNGHKKDGTPNGLSPTAYDHGITKEIHNYFNDGSLDLQASFQLTWDNQHNRLKVYAAMTGQTLYLTPAQIKAAAENEQEYMDSVDYAEQRKLLNNNNNNSTPKTWSEKLTALGRKFGLPDN